MSEVKRSPCRYCLNARSDPDHKLADNNDLSYFPVGFGDSDNPFSDLVIVSGSGSPVSIVATSVDPFRDLRDVRTYFPRYCPECGRFLMDDYPERSSLYGQERK